ncbi:hypothetical protein ABZW32_27315 [Streptomyces sp. NPDC004667]|uniref:hypothetical protein n=1 Tax=Streptomyces sp. NPDC004667 TaxID=3154285 RepID=UPI0033A05AE8
MRAASGPLSGGEKSDPDALRAVGRAEQALGQAHQHVTTLAGAYRAGEPEQQERAEAV